jgi:hypothetical protein
MAAWSRKAPIGARVRLSVIERDSLGHQGGVPATAVLVGERDQVSVLGCSCATPGVSEQHQCQLARDLAVVREQAMHVPD